MKILDAANNVADAYDWDNQRPAEVADVGTKRAQAYLTKDKVLIIPGSDGLRDYTDFNLKLGGASIAWSETSTELGNTKWYRGFALHANDIVQQMKTRRPKFVIGHSLGAAAAQILACYYRVPAIGFASPKPRKSTGSRLKYEHLVLNILRTDDKVTTLPPDRFGFKHIGTTMPLQPKTTNFGLDHSMKQYLQIIRPAIQAGQIADHWPLKR